MTNVLSEAVGTAQEATLVRFRYMEDGHMSYTGASLSVKENERNNSHFHLMKANWFAATGLSYTPQPKHKCTRDNGIKLTSIQTRVKLFRQKLGFLINQQKHHDLMTHRKIFILKLIITQIC